LGQGEELAIGSIENLVVVDGESISVVDRASAASKSSNNPYLGMKLRGAVIHTIYQGILVVCNQQLTGYNAVSNA
jgi:dihydroorotase-like cyclic amidohydrolase